MTAKLSDTYFLKRAGRYSDPLNSNDRLPIVYGDVTDGSNGIWELPRIADEAGVPKKPIYCFAGHPVRPRFETLTLDVAPGGVGWSVGETITGAVSGTTSIITEVTTTKIYRIKQRDGFYNGGEILTNGVDPADQGVLYPQYSDSTITIYQDGSELGQALYTFEESNNYEGHGNIAIIKFISPKANDIITAQGQGKVSAGTTLMENIVDIVEDFLTVENDFAASLFESTAKAMAASIFTGQNYVAAGCIIQDVPIWETITKMMSSFLGSVYINGEDKLVLDIDINTIPLGYADIIPKGDAYLSDAKIRRDNIINQCPINFAYNYVNGRFKSHTDDSAHADAISQDVFGVRTPNTPYQAYWCRDLTSIQQVQDYIVAKLKDPLYEIEITDATLKRAGVDIGDFVAFSADSLYGQDGIQLLNNFWKILSVKPNYGKNNIVYRALQTGYFMTLARILDGSWILDGSVKLGGQRDLTTY